MAGPRFLTIADVAEVLNISARQAYELVRSQQIPALRVGGRGQWRIEAAELEAWIQRAYSDARDFLASQEGASLEEADFEAGDDGT